MTERPFNSSLARFVQRPLKRPALAILGWGVCGGIPTLSVDKSIVCHCHRAANRVIRIISARKADKQEETSYWSGR